MSRSPRSSSSGRVLGGMLIVALLSALAGAGVTGVTSARADSSGDVSLNVKVISPPVIVLEVVPEVPVGTPIAEATFTFRLTGLDPYVYVEVYAQSTPVLIATGYADALGVFNASVQVPATLLPGDHSIKAVVTLADGKKQEVTVVAFRISPTGTVASTETNTGSSSTSTTGTATVSQTEVPAEELGSIPTNDPFLVGGTLWCGGLSVRAGYADGVAFPAVVNTIVVQNVAAVPVSAVASFDLRSAIGVPVGQVDVKIIDIAPGEIRRVVVTQKNVGSWGLYQSSMRLEQNDDGVSFERHATVWVFPLFILLIALAGVLAWMLLRVIKLRSAPISVEAEAHPADHDAMAEAK